MRRFDRKLSDKIYTDSNLLPMGEVVRNLPDDENLIKILTNISGESGLNGSNSVKTGLVKTEPKNRLKPASVQGLVPQKVFETLVEVAGIEPDTPCAKTSVSIKGSEFPIEALIEILTEISDTDHQILGRIVGRLGSRSEELNDVVLRVVGRLISPNQLGRNDDLSVDQKLKVIVPYIDYLRVSVVKLPEPVR